MKELIYNQNDIPRERWRYGFRSSAKVGCGWVATSNALVIMGHDVDVEKLIRSYERQMPLVNGNAGTVIWGPARLLKKMGYSVKTCRHLNRFDALCRDSDVGILFYYWRKGWRIGSHFIAVRYRDGKFYSYNTYSNSKGPDYCGDSLESFIRRKKFFGCVFFGIKDKM